ncbi:hypothetical protein [Colwellia sp. MEBiC06753]
MLKAMLNAKLKTLVTVVATLSVSLAAQAANNDIWQCVDAKTLNAEQQCVASTLENNVDNAEFFKELAHKDFTAERPVFATVTLYQERHLIEVVALEKAETAGLTASR